MEWISVKDKSPGPGRYWVSMRHDRSGKRKHLSKKYYSGYWSMTRNEKHGGWRITHWMPLPEPPEDRANRQGLEPDDGYT